MGRREKLAPCIWKDAYGISVVVRTRANGYREVRFRRGTPLRELKAEVDKLRVELRSTRRRRTDPTTLADDVKTYLLAVKAMPTYSEREKHLETWLACLDADGQPFATRRRDTIQPHEIQAQRDRWRTVPDPKTKKVKAPGTVNKYLRSLSNLYRVLDPKGENPVRAVAECDEPAEIPRAIPLAIANAILTSLRPSKTRARLEVVATTGIEQSTFAQLTPADVDLEQRTVRLPRRRKGRKGAPARVLPLTLAAVRAFKAVQRWDAWGAYSTSSVYKSFKAACANVEQAHNAKARRPADRIALGELRPKDLRHTFGTAISLATGGNTRTIQRFLGHATDVMAARYSQAAIPVHLRDAVNKMTRQKMSVSTGVSRPALHRKVASKGSGLP